MDDGIYIKPLGAGNEVGRSCIHVKYKNKEILLDCGVHPAYTGVSSLPFLDLVDLSKIDAILITHFHLDHAAALPFLTEKTNFKGKVYMTHPTKAILRWLLNDYIRVINSSSDEDFYSEKDLTNCYNKIIPVDYHQQVNINGIKFTAFNAGHVLGAAMFLLEIEQSKLLYTGDFSREDDRHLKAAESPNCKLDILITEATYGTQCHLPRSEREARFTKVVSDVVERGGRCLLPVFALGRAQELLLILEEHWSENPKLSNIPIYYASALAKKCISIYQTYVNMMNERIQKISLTRNPFDFKHIEYLQDIYSFKDDGPCVIMASPGMLQSGLSRELFERWCSNSKNGVVIPGYCVEGTLAKDILSEPKEIESSKGQMLKLNMTVEYISFSAHVDYTQNSQFIDECSPKHLFFVHGEVNEMMRLKNTISLKNDKNGVEMLLYALKNGEEAVVPVIRENYGKLYTEKSEFDALVVLENDEFFVYDFNDVIDQKTNLKKLKFFQKQKIPYNSTFNLLKQILTEEFDAEEIFCNNFNNIYNIYNKEDNKSSIIIVNKESVEDMNIENSSKQNNINNKNELINDISKKSYLKVGGIKIFFETSEILMEWESNYCDDVTALAINKSIRDIGCNIKSLRMAKIDNLNFIFKTLKGYFEDVILENDNIIINGCVTVRNGEVKGTCLSTIEIVKNLLSRLECILHKH